ncbi:MAG: alkaline phosphatase family protein [Verrucomicrobia bacterium]|nr:alkaline phosphatase family protein [Verrucomicrobiota bacterium]
MKTLVPAILRWVVLLSGLTAGRALALPQRPIPAVEHVLIISVDGMRPDCALRADMPVLRGLMREGAYTFWAKTTAVSVTLPSHTSMLTGVTPAKHGIVWNKELPFREPVYPAMPTILELATQAGYDTAMIAGKTKLALLNKPGTISHVFLPAPKQEVTDALVADDAIRIIAAYQPALTFVHFPGPDATGHAKGWGSPEQIATLEGIDRQLARLRAALDQAGILGSTVIIVSADHGGAGLTHGADDVRSRHIPWIISGPGLRKNYDLTRDAALEVRTEDTCATACYLLGLPLKEYFDGKPVYAAFAPAK